MPVPTFDPVNKYILLGDESPDYTITAQEIYNASMDWHDNQGNMDDDPPMRSAGYANLGGGAYSDKIFILQKDWKLKPYSGTYTLKVTGTLIALDDAGQPYDRTVPPDSGTVIWVFQVTSQGIVVISGSGVTEQDKIDIANKVEALTGQPIKTKVNPLPADPAKESSVDELESGLSELHGQIVDVVIQLTNIENIQTGKIILEGNILTIYDYIDPNKIYARYKLTIVDGKVAGREKIA